MVTLLLVSSVSWESSAINGALRILLIIELTTDLGKPFHDANILMVLISYGNLSIEHIRDALAARFLIYEIYVQGTKLVKLICCSFDFHTLRRWF